MSTLAVVEEILCETEVPMSVRQIVEYASGRLPTKSKTPDTVVARDLSMDIKKKGDSSLFVRTAPGRYTMRALHVRTIAEPEVATRHESVAATMVPPSMPPRQEAPASVLSSAIRSERAGTLAAPRSPHSEQSASIHQH